MWEAILCLIYSLVTLVIPASVGAQASRLVSTTTARTQIVSSETDVKNMTDSMEDIEK